MSSQDIDKAYVSPYDKFLYEFNKNNAPSASQLKEAAKHNRIAELRDNPDALNLDLDIWKEF